MSWPSVAIEVATPVSTTPRGFQARQSPHGEPGRRERGPSSWPSRRLSWLLVGLAAAIVPCQALGSESAPPQLPQSAESIQFAQNGDGEVAETSSEAQRPFIWAGRFPRKDTISSFYVPCCRDPLSTTGKATAAKPHDLAWFRENHPDWLVYADRADDEPLKGGRGNLWALNLAHPDVRKYMIAYALGRCDASSHATCESDLPQHLRKGVAAGFRFIALDNLSPANILGLQGYYAPVEGCRDGPLACKAPWIQRYTGAREDPAFVADVTGYVRELRAALNASGAGLATNSKLYVRDVATSAALAVEADVKLAESPFLRACRRGATDFVDDANWLAQAAFRARIWNKVPVIDLNYLCGRPVDQITQAEAAYVVANHLLFKDDRSFLAIQNGANFGRQDVGTVISYPDELKPSVGKPTAPPPTRASDGGCWERTFEFGLAAVWPREKGSCVVTVPPGSWTTQFGTAAAPGPYTLQSDPRGGPSALVLVKARPDAAPR